VQAPATTAPRPADGAVIVQAVSATGADQGSWIPSVQTVSPAEVVAVSAQPGTVLVYPGGQEQQVIQHQQDQVLREQIQQEEEQHDLALSGDDLLDEVVYVGDGQPGYAYLPTKAARLDDTEPRHAALHQHRPPIGASRSQNRDAVPLGHYARVTAQDLQRPSTEDWQQDQSSNEQTYEEVEGELEGSGSSPQEVALPEYDPYGVFWSSPSGATNAEQAESQQLAGAFADEDVVSGRSAVDQTEPPAEGSTSVDRTINMCLDGKCMFIYEPGRQIRVQH